MIGLTSFLIDERDALRQALDATVRREAIVATKLAGAREERDAFSRAHADKCQQVADLQADLEQVRLYIQDALLCDDDLGLIRDVLHAALDVGRP